MQSLQFLFIENFVFFGGFLFTLALATLALLSGDLEVDGDTDAGGAGFDFDLDVDLDIDTDLDFEFDLEFDLDPDLSSKPNSVGGGGNILGFLLPSGVPLTVTLAVYALCFSVLGYIIQLVAMNVVGHGLPHPIAIPLAAVAAWGTGRSIAGWIGANLLKTETAALGPRQMLGLSGEVSVGTATPNRSAEVRVVDRFGNPHYLRARAADGSDPLKGSVRLTGYRKATKEYIVKAF